MTLLMLPNLFRVTWMRWCHAVLTRVRSVVLIIGALMVVLGGFFSVLSILFLLMGHQWHRAEMLTGLLLLGSALTWFELWRQSRHMGLSTQDARVGTLWDAWQTYQKQHGAMKGLHIGAFFFGGVLFWMSEAIFGVRFLLRWFKYSKWQAAAQHVVGWVHHWPERVRQKNEAFLSAHPDAAQRLAQHSADALSQKMQGPTASTDARPRL